MHVSCSCLLTQSGYKYLDFCKLLIVFWFPWRSSGPNCSCTSTHEDPVRLCIRTSISRIWTVPVHCAQTTFSCHVRKPLFTSLGQPCCPWVALESLRMSIIKVQILVCIHICNNESIVYTNLGERMLAKNSLLVDPSGIFETKQSPFTISTTCEKQMKILALNHWTRFNIYNVGYTMFLVVEINRTT